MPAKFPFSVRQHRYVHAVTFDQRRIAINVDDLDIESKAGLQFLQAHAHFLAKMTMTAAVDSKYRPGGLSTLFPNLGHVPLRRLRSQIPE